MDGHKKWLFIATVRVLWAIEAKASPFLGDESRGLTRFHKDDCAPSHACITIGTHPYMYSSGSYV